MPKIHNRINYVNFQEIFPIKPGLKDRVEIEKLDVEGDYPEPFNYLCTLHDVYLFPERVKKYAESLQYSNSADIVNYAPVSRTYAPIDSRVITTIKDIILDVYGRYVEHTPMDHIGMFSFTSDPTIDYQKHNDGHFDIQDNDEKVMNGVLHLEDHLGTEIMVYKELFAMTRPISGASAVYPEGADSHLKTVATTSGKFNTLNLYYGHFLHRPDYNRKKRPHKNGRLIQNMFFDDCTSKIIVQKREQAQKAQFAAADEYIKYDTMNSLIMNDRPYKDREQLNLNVGEGKINKINDPLIKKIIKERKELGFYDITFKREQDLLSEAEWEEKLKK